MLLEYSTRDGHGNDIIKQVRIKEFKEFKIEFTCPICNKDVKCGNRIKDIVSANFTDWAYVGDYVCKDCARLFSLYFYNYIVNPDGIRLVNIRELRDELIKKQKTPFLFIISTSQKKHLFYRAKWNDSADKFAVNLETETIYTTTDRMKELFDFVECLQTLGASKGDLSQGVIPFPILQKTGFAPLKKLKAEIETSREIQIPLYCGQKREITEEEAICCINSTLKV